MIVLALLCFSLDERLLSNNIFLIRKIKEKEEGQENRSSNNLSSRHTDYESIYGEFTNIDNSKKFDKFWEIIKNPVYTFSCLTISNFLFISTAVLFWTSDYLLNVLHATHKEVFIIFTIICLTGPVFGVIIGGALVQKFAKGYEGKHSIVFTLLYTICAGISAVPIKWIHNPVSFGVCLWIIVFFGGAIMPTLQGVMISSLSSELRAAGNSLSNILQNLFAFIPAPFIYGYFYENTKYFDPTLAMTMTLWYSFIGIFFISFTLYYRYKYWNEIQKNLNIMNKEESYFVQNEESQCILKNEL